ncbi:serine hydrolase [Phycicoccus sp. CSK15P-2]|uniref:serine hydrolase domain-containing protein n=1 Tax=Phycicoccus sp. CSK15P-2 TaxID=2807627 RepID=UPI00194F8B72|nr:serine hydrolase [Phycicoccus sp. CSK15P-2]MBM6404057.1 serine hydrolase [Phycicoccus sp. CSK15P-2]
MTTPTAAPLPRSAPAEHGVPPQALEHLVQRWLGSGVEPHGLVVVRHGHVVAERSWTPYDHRRPGLVYSVSKTFTACAVGFAEAEGRLSLDERVVDLFPEAADVAGPRAARLTLHDVLSMSTGHRADTLVSRDGSLEDFPRTFLGAEPEEEPGTWFVYHNGASLVTALAVQRRVGERLVDYLGPRLFDPLGIVGPSWQHLGRTDIGYSGLHVSTEALAHLGELVLRDGVWHGRRVLPEGWTARMTARHTDTSMHPGTTDWQQGYGYQMWQCRHGAVRADGAWGQFSVVVPEADLVVAVTSCSQDTQALLDAVWEELLPVLDDDALTALPPPPEQRPDGPSTLPALASQVAPDGIGPWHFAHTPTEEHPSLRSVVVDRAGDGWTLHVDDHRTVTVPCADGGWPAVTDARSTPWVASGGWTAPGVFETTVAAVVTPHTLRLRCADGRVSARWNGLPLGRASLRALTLPSD